jgi:hypothetical protein
MSNFNYCPVVCHFCGESNTKKMEKIQKRALGFIYEDCNSDYDTLLLKSGLPSLKIRRLRMKAIEIFKILHRQLPAYLNDIVSFKHISYSFRRQQTVEIPQVRTTNFGLHEQHSVRYGGATLWNELPDAIRAQTNLNQFKSLINNWNGNSCRCGSCRSYYFHASFYVECFQICLAFSLALFIFIFALYVLISQFLLLLICCMQFCFPYAMLIYVCASC